MGRAPTDEINLYLRSSPTGLTVSSNTCRARIFMPRLSLVGPRRVAATIDLAGSVEVWNHPYRVA